nr:fimbria/pilus periplasmic chaperone [Caldimonas sp.]
MSGLPIARLRSVVLAVSLLAATMAASAGSLSISPIRVDIAPGQRSVTLIVRNDGDQTTLVQTQLAAWSQADNEDRLEPTTDLLASPPIFELVPGGVQIVRLALRRPADADRERSYRIVVSEVPGPPQPGFTGATFALKLSLPVFVDADGSLVLAATNTGAKHVQVRAVDVLHDGPGVDARHAGLWYVLPGQRRIVTVAPLPGRAIAPDRVRIHADTDAGIVAADVVLDPR